MPTALGCYTDIKPGSYPNSINVDNNGVITIAIQKETTNGEIILPENVKLLLYKDDVLVSTLQNVPHTYRYTDVIIDPKLTGEGSEGYYAGPGYILKFRTQDLSKLFAGYVGEENLCLQIRFWDSHLVYRVGIDSVRLISNNND